MKNKPIELYVIGGITGFLGGILMIACGYLLMFQVQDAYLGSLDHKMAFIASHPLVGITHGANIASLILIVPAALALFTLLNTVAFTRSLLGTTFALLWIIIELIGHLWHTAPLRALSELYNNLPTRDAALSIYSISSEFWEALSLTGTFFSVLMSLCYGLVLIDNWNRPSGYLFLIACIAFPIGIALPRIGIQPHIILRGLAFVIVSGVLVKRALAEEE